MEDASISGQREQAGETKHESTAQLLTRLLATYQHSTSTQHVYTVCHCVLSMKLEGDTAESHLGCTHTEDL